MNRRIKRVFHNLWCSLIVVLVIPFILADVIAYWRYKANTWERQIARREKQAKDRRFHSLLVADAASRRERWHSAWKKLTR